MTDDVGPARAGDGRAALVRHCETEKNARALHGQSDLSELTDRGQRQLVRLARRIESTGWPYVEVVSAPTSQARTTARALATRLGLPLGGEIGLAPYSLGVAEGLSDLALAGRDLRAVETLSAFRSGLIPSSELRVGAAEDWAHVRDRLRDWWVGSNDGLVLRNRIVVTSRSTFVMLVNLLAGGWDSEQGYHHASLATGEFIEFALQQGGWRALTASVACLEEFFELSSPLGIIRGIVRRPRFEERRRAIVVVPGFFGATSEGPYSLYRKLSDRLVEEGYTVLRFDPLGSGLSSSGWRSVTADARSLDVVASHVRKRLGLKSTFLCHSLGCVPAMLHAGPAQSVIALAPVGSLTGGRVDILSKSHLEMLAESNVCAYKKIPLTTQDLHLIEDAWVTHGSNISIALVGTEDPYFVATKEVGAIPIRRIPDADHNFSNAVGFEGMMDALLDALESLDDEWA